MEKEKEFFVLCGGTLPDTPTQRGGPSLMLCWLNANKSLQYGRVLETGVAITGYTHGFGLRCRITVCVRVCLAGSSLAQSRCTM